MGLDLADKRCAAHAVPVGRAKKSQKEFLDGFNKDFRLGILGLSCYIEGTRSGP